MIRIPRRFSSFAPPLIKRKVRSGGVTGHVSDGAFTMAAINSRRNRRALHAESRDADSAFVAKETFTTRGKSTLYISGGGEVRDKEPPPWRQNCARIFPAGERERERDRSRSAVRKKGSRSFVKTGDVDDLKIERESR